MTNEKDRSCATPYKTMIGGQALIEGIMMLGPEKKESLFRYRRTGRAGRRYDEK